MMDEFTRPTEPKSALATVATYAIGVISCLAVLAGALALWIAVFAWVILEVSGVSIRG